MSDVNLTPISAAATMWGGQTISAKALNYINSSPLMVQYLNQYQAEVDAKTAGPIGLYTPKDADGNLNYQSNGEQTYAIGSKIQIDLGGAVWA
ncbi:hypothetical protein [Burkholderia lata]|uniref:hypothetical protein n=1 Tax=Burkholderia lata (strain ATCC 17760 / DSM 23089 / LMG 22485 / NCIMB 9086 / R18194 / 383) TaxID=482957 RepID=UPI001583677E|nr:hypothetical protein [Burkholderia lata]